MTDLSAIRAHIKQNGSITRAQFDWLMSRAEVAQLLEDRVLVPPPWTHVLEDLIERCVGAVENAVEKLPQKTTPAQWLEIQRAWRELIQTVGDLP